MTNETLRREIGFLGTYLGETIKELEGEKAFQIVEDLRRCAWDRRSGRELADQKMHDLITGLSDSQIRVVIRAFSVFLDLLNLVEDRRRVQVLQERAKKAYPGPRPESIWAAVAAWKAAGLSAEDAQAYLDGLHLDLVFTAHPTDAKRRSVRSKLRRIRQLLRVDDTDQLPSARDKNHDAIRAEIVKLWQTDFIRPWRPSVMQEVSRGLSLKPVLWGEVPQIADELKHALHECYGDKVQATQSPITFGSWIGSDRDGHPGVTAEVTDETFDWLRREAIQFHLQTCDELFDSLSTSSRQVEMDPDLVAAIDAAVARWPGLEARLASLPPGEHFRRWLSIIRWKLEQSESNLDTPASESGYMVAEAGYVAGEDLANDVQILIQATTKMKGGRHASVELKDWMTRIHTFGLHLARLDVRQNAKIHHEVVDEIFRLSGWNEDLSSLQGDERVAALVETMGKKIAVPLEDMSSTARETLSVFEVLHQVAERCSTAAMGAYVISMTSTPCDVLTVLWFWELTRKSSDNDPGECLPIAPLLETIDDLKAGISIFRGMLAIPAYRDLLRKQGNRQMIMLGYSDSTKDGGSMSACWALHQAQRELVQVAREHDLEITFFHGRGGSLGRGGGPAARGILSLPRDTFHGSLRLTEQGEVLAERYDDPVIAHRHLEQLLWASLLTANTHGDDESHRWYGLMDQLAERSLVKYRQLVEAPGFVEYFRTVTPISEIEQLPIGSRPSRRKPDGGLADLRAIPWVFSWTQVRCLIPAWYGLGSALSEAMEKEHTLQELRDMYQHWPFFRAMIDNAELALVKSDLGITRAYAALASQRPELSQIGDSVEQEFQASTEVVLKLTGREQLLDGTPWLQESIRVRNRFIDPLNLIQVELLKRVQALEGKEVPVELRHLTRLSINGIAAGMRTSG